jgi:hypothetical protein
MEWNSQNVGIYQVVRVWGQSAFWVAGTDFVPEIIQLLDPNDITFYTYDSVMPGDIVNIASNVLGTANIGQYTVLDDVMVGSNFTSYFPTSTQLYTTAVPQANVLPIPLGTQYDTVSILEGDPLTLYKHVVTVGPGPSGTSLATVTVDTPALLSRISNSLGAYMTIQNKLGYDLDLHVGLDGYKYYNGLLKQLNLVIYGDPTSPLTNPGVRSAGTNLDIKPAAIYRIEISVNVQIKIGLSPTDLSNRIKASIAGYVNQLGVGQPVALAGVIDAAWQVNGVTDVSIVSPPYTATQYQIAVGANQTAKVINPQTDITVSIVGD